MILLWYRIVYRITAVFSPGIEVCLIPKYCCYSIEMGEGRVGGRTVLWYRIVYQITAVILQVLRRCVLYLNTVVTVYKLRCVLLYSIVDQYTAVIPLVQRKCVLWYSIVC